MEYYYDQTNDFYVIKLNGSFNQVEYMKILREILQKEKRDDLSIFYTTLTNDNKYVVIDYQKRKYTDDELKNLLEHKRKVR